MSDNNFTGGAVRSADADHLDFMSMPLLGLIGIARTAHEGGTKYGRFNYMKGMPAHVCVNHAMRHLIMWAIGDRSEPHLEHAGWNCMTASQSILLHPEINAPHLPGPGFTLTSDILDHLDANAADLAEKRKKGVFASIGEWTMSKLPEVQKVLEQRICSGLPVMTKQLPSPDVKPKADTATAGYLKLLARDGAVVAKFNGQTKIVPRTIYHRNDKSATAKTWDVVLPVERPEDWYALMSPGMVNLHVLVIDKKVWQVALDVVADDSVPTPLPAEVLRDSKGVEIPLSLLIYTKGKHRIRYTTDHGDPVCGPGETWCDYEGGHRLYWTVNAVAAVPTLNQR